MKALAPGDPDDFMRLDQVRDWLAGQSWWDVRQYRMDPPAGADMHWSRLVDLPIAACLLLARLVLPEPAASIAAMTAVPLLQLLLAMALLRALMRTLGASAGAVLAAAALPLAFPLLLDNFMPHAGSTTMAGRRWPRSAPRCSRCAPAGAMPLRPAASPRRG